MDHNNNYERSHTALYQDPWKLIKHSDGGQELYELSTDPAETTDRSLMNPQQAARMSAQLSAYRQRTGLLFPSTEGLLDEETKRRLRTLGYID